jgi:hypothetical protein
MIAEYLYKLRQKGNKHVFAVVPRLFRLSGKVLRDLERVAQKAVLRPRIAAGQRAARSENQALKAESVRGRLGYMQYIHGFIGCVLVLLALIHLPYPYPLAWLPYAIAACLAFIPLKSEISIGLSRILAITTAGIMFFFFAWFFVKVPTLDHDWYASQAGWAAVCRILAAFVMIPILSEYSCRLKADCREARARDRAFFTVPEHIRP